MLKVTRENGGQNRGQRELRHEAMLQGVDGVADDRAQCVLGECDLCERESYVDEWPLAKRHVAHDSDCEDWSTVQKGEEASSSAARLNIVEQADMCAKGARGGKRNHVGRDGAQCGDEPTPPQAKDKDRDPGKEVWNARDEHERLACNKEAEEKERTAQNAKALHALLQAGAVEEDSICTRQDEKHGHAGKESHEPRQSPTALLNLKFKKTLIAPGRDDHGRAPTFPCRVNRGGPPVGGCGGRTPNPNSTSGVLVNIASRVKLYRSLADALRSLTDFTRFARSLFARFALSVLSLTRSHALRSLRSRSRSRSQFTRSQF